VEQWDGLQRACVDHMCQDMINARTPMDILSAIHDVNADQDAVSGTRPDEVDVGELSQLQQLIVLPGESDPPEWRIKAANSNGGGAGGFCGMGGPI
jgi:hypothetical protein